MAQKDYDKRTALHLASAEGHSDCVRYLVENCNIAPVARDRLDKTLKFDIFSYGIFLDGVSHPL